MSIDHIMPENLLESPENLENIKRDYKLSHDFNINGFENWVPAHNNCNSRKGTKLYTNSPIFIAALGVVSKKSENIKKEYEKLKSSQHKDNAFAKLMIDLEKNSILYDDLAELYHDLVELLKKQMPFGIVSQVPILKENERNHIPEGAQILSIDQNKRYISIVMGDGRRGEVPIDNEPHINWLCPRCKQYGPWNGIICISCGYRACD